MTATMTKRATGELVCDTSHGLPWHVKQTDSDMTVCRIGGCPDSIVDEDECEAYAKLFKAAPDLLDALMAFVSYCSYEINSNKHWRVVVGISIRSKHATEQDAKLEIVRMRKAAIGKATS